MDDDNSQNPSIPSLGALFDDARFTNGRELPGGKNPRADFNRVASTIDPFTHEYLNRRIVRLTGPINDAKAAQVISFMQMLSDMDPDADIELRINSPGGSVTAGLAIYDAMKDLPCDVKTTCEGMCASMAAVLLAAGTPGKRTAMPNSTIMVHGIGIDGAGGKLAEVKITEREMERLQKILTDILAQYSGMPATYVDHLMTKDNFMAPADAKKLGLIDEIRVPRHQPPTQTPAVNLPAMPPQYPSYGTSPTVN